MNIFPEALAYIHLSFSDQSYITYPALTARDAGKMSSCFSLALERKQASDMGSSNSSALTNKVSNSQADSGGGARPGTQVCVPLKSMLLLTKC